MARVRWSRIAYRDVRSALGYLDGAPSAARALRVRVGNATQMLRSYPLLGRIVPEYQDEAVRELIVHRSRFSAHDALSGIEDTFLNNGVVVAMRHGRYVQLLYRSVEEGTLGGQVHDAAIVACARQAGVAEILTFNDRHVRRFVGDGLTIAVP